MNEAMRELLKEQHAYLSSEAIGSILHLSVLSDRFEALAVTSDGILNKHLLPGFLPAVSWRYAHGRALEVPTL